MSENKNKPKKKKFILWLFLFSSVLVIVVVGSYVYFNLFKQGEDLYIFGEKKVSQEIAKYNTRIFDKNKVTVNKREAIAIAQEFLNTSEDVKKLSELGELKNTWSYLDVCHYDPAQQQYFLLLDEPTGELADNFTSRLCHRVLFEFTDKNNSTEILVGAEDGKIAHWTQGVKLPQEMDYFQQKPAGNFVIRQEVDLDGDDNKEILAIAHPTEPNELGVLPVYFLSYSYVPSASSWIWSYQFLRSVDPSAQASIKDMVAINTDKDVTGDGVNEVLVTLNSSENSGGKLVVYLDSLNYLWTGLLYFGDLPRGEVELRSDQLTVSESTWGENDAQCCPSGRLETIYTFDGKRMIKTTDLNK